MSVEEARLELCNLSKSQYPEIKALMDEVYNELGGAWPKHTIDYLIDEFPEGQIGIVDEGKLVGIALSVQVDHKRFSNPHTYEDIVDSNDNVKHQADGDSIYGLDVVIAHSHRGMRLGRRLYDARKELCRQYNLRAILAGGRIPQYYKYADQMTPTEYISSVDRKEIYDPILSFQLANDFQVTRLLKKYLPDDDRSGGYATLLEWNNILYEPTETVIESRKTTVRVGAVQWLMRPMQSVEEMMQQVEYFVDTVSDYQSDFIVFPEFFNAPLMGLAEHQSQTEAIRFLAGYTEQFREEMTRLAIEYNANIITGSMPLNEDGIIYNVSYLCHRSGKVDEQRKVHITPHEKYDWVIQGGDKVSVFDTDAGKVGILICYDVEFPELSRLMAEQGLEILFVPFWTDTKNSYLRVRLCAQARAIENECYVVIAGSVGNLPKVDSLDVQYSQSAVLTPSDYPFSHDAILSEATANTEMLLFSDLDMDKLKLLHSEGTVQNLKDRRHDLYEVKVKK
ncbi:bifunctional GNAT family N-acetyltransferase/carbon-nitrogen hydrolase family protein [Aestuariibacter halophilus]|uniref:Bifunctional GNAT family N-acetyltransferase/carbon-nitrogen hydrolase family protein n=1 Tax=Fluctibacter halophilus TaxID=226011 RepID=A0ABS8G9N5_9ALTE|nr:bifunctional GNAT family N-acetyltransferase/carbon-nitrogen hydrolase family protein [Aestuariibacter halophilus]MCC2617287.1 bifunctional GNAT family N-acetyltransferase/carbon-nitrogen hydrolase family protein [Aestuariibacter halophilus]